MEEQYIIIMEPMLVFIFNIFLNNNVSTFGDTIFNSQYGIILFQIVYLMKIMLILIGGTIRWWKYHN